MTETLTHRPAIRHGPRTVHIIVPEGIDDPREPSGGNAYDRRVCLGLAGAGWTVHEHPVAGAWPRPGPTAREALHSVLAGLPDGSVVLIDGLVACGVPDVVVPQAARLRLVVLLHLPLGDEQGRSPTVSASLAGLERRTLRAAAAVVATSGWAARRAIAVHGLAPRRVHVVTPGVEPAPVAAGTEGASRLLCVGALTRTKGQDLLVDALATVPDRPWSCDLVGPLHRAPEFVAELRKSIGRHGLDRRVRLTGPLSGTPLDAAYATADLLVLPSRAETYGMVITEALARAVPVLAAATGGVPDTLGTAPPAAPARAVSPLIRPPARPPGAMSPLIAGRAADGGVPGLLVRPDDSDALADGLRRWCDDAELRTGLRRAAALRRHELTGWEVTTRCLSQVLNRLHETAA